MPPAKGGGMEVYMRKNVASLLLAVTIAISSFSSLAGQWINSSVNWYYLDDNGNYLKNQWLGNYYLGADGVMMRDSWTPDGYYVGSDGAWTGQTANYSSQTSGSNNLASNSTSLDGTYYYAYTFTAGIGQYYEYAFNPITLVQNQNGTYTLMSDYFGTVILEKQNDGRYVGYHNEESYHLDYNGLDIEWGDSYDYFTRIESKSASINQSLTKQDVHGTYYNPEWGEYMDIAVIDLSTISVEYYGYTMSGERHHAYFTDYTKIGENTWTSLPSDYGKYSIEYGAHTIYYDGNNTITAQADGYEPIYYYRA